MALSLLLFFTLFFAVAFLWPTLRLWKRDRVNALVLPRDDSVEGFVGTCFRGLIASIFLLLIMLSRGLPNDAVGTLPWLDSPISWAAGWFILAVALIWVVTAQAQMGASWRIGIDTASQTRLVSTGVFSISRNPIFLGMRASLLGLFLTLPNGFTLAVLLAGEILMQVQVRLEEPFLKATHGPDYADYSAAVRRWI